MKILHVVPGLEEKWNGIAVAARLIAGEQGADIVDARRFGRLVGGGSCSGSWSGSWKGRYDEIWVHSNWTMQVLLACWRVIRAGRPLVRMTHANLDPVRYRYHGWKKRLVAPIERWLYRRTQRVVVTCEEEAAWCRQWGVDRPIEVQDIRRFFRLEGPIADPRARGNRPLHVLYLGRPHPLKGIPFLEKAVNELNSSTLQLQLPTTTKPPKPPKPPHPLDLRIVSNAFGDEKAAVWQWADILCLPTLSDNLGLVIAEALERGKFVITTDGAPAWASFFAAHPTHGLYLSGYRTSDDQTRIKLLSAALRRYL